MANERWKRSRLIQQLLFSYDNSEIKTVDLHLPATHLTAFKLGGRGEILSADSHYQDKEELRMLTQ